MTTKITITDRFIYNLIKSYTKNDKPFFASNNYLAKELNKSISVISHSISRLLKLEYLENRGNKMCRQLYTKNDLLSADFDIKNANNSKESAENSISLEEFKREYAKNSTNKMLKTAIESAENSNILISILLSYTNKYIYSEEDLKNKKENIPFLDLVKKVNKNKKEEIINLVLHNWNVRFFEMHNLSKIKNIDKTRETNLFKRLEECDKNNLNNAVKIFFNAWNEKIKANDFYKGANNRNWKMDFDFAITKSKFIPVLEEYLQNKEVENEY